MMSALLIRGIYKFLSQFFDFKHPFLKTLFFDTFDTIYKNVFIGLH